MDDRYQTGEEGGLWLYPAAGDPLPTPNCKVQLLTIGGVHISGPWVNNGFYLAWLPLPKRDRVKEDLIKDKLI